MTKLTGEDFICNGDRATCRIQITSRRFAEQTTIVPLLYEHRHLPLQSVQAITSPPTTPVSEWILPISHLNLLFICDHRILIPKIPKIGGMYAPHQGPWNVDADADCTLRFVEGKWPPKLCRRALVELRRQPWWAIWNHKGERLQLQFPPSSFVMSVLSNDSELLFLNFYHCASNLLFTCDHGILTPKL